MERRGGLERHEHVAGGRERHRLFRASNETFYAVDAKTGAPKWHASTDGAILSSAAVVNGIVYVGSEDDYLYAFNAETGKALWSVPTGDSIENSSPVVANALSMSARMTRGFTLSTRQPGRSMDHLRQ